MKTRFHLLFLVACGQPLLSGSGASVRDVDFRNFQYPFIVNELASVPDKISWIIPTSRAQVIQMRDGRFTVPCDAGDSCPLLTLDGIDFGHLDGLPDTSALVMLTYHSGGTATWQYVYVIAQRAEKPEVVAYLRTGSRGSAGLRKLQAEHGELVLVVNDPGKRFGDCCSRGTITYRYKWMHGSFRQASEPVYMDAENTP